MAPPVYITEKKKKRNKNPGDLGIENVKTELKETPVGGDGGKWWVAGYVVDCGVYGGCNGLGGHSMAQGRAAGLGLKFRN
jgi:hypothetical protein